MSAKAPLDSLSRVGETPQQQDDDDDDNLSITSTYVGDNDSEKEWGVEDVLAERLQAGVPGVPGVRQFLIRWDGFALEDSTWEPIENLGDGLLAKWEENKTEIDAGTREDFDLATYYAACEARTVRHMRRNAKRQRLGMPMTPPFPPGYTDVMPVTSLVASPVVSPAGGDSSCSGDEARDVDDVVDEVDLPSGASSRSKATAFSLTPPSTATTLTAAPAARKPTKQHTFIGIPPPAPPKHSSTSQVPERSRDRQSPPSLQRTSAKASVSDSIPPITSGPTRKGSGGTVTGYQGTAGRSSVFRSNTTKVSVQNTSIVPNKPPPTGKELPALSSSAGNNFKPKRLTATRTRPLSATPVTNVFIGGKQRKKRASLGDVMADTSKAPKPFTNMHLMNVAKKRGIEKGDAAGTLSSIPSRFIISNEQANTGPRKPGLVSPTTADPPLQTQESSNPPSTSPTAPSKPSASSGPPQQEVTRETPTLKRKKSVRFTGEDNDGLVNPTEGLLDGNIEIEAHTKGSETSKELPIPSKKLSLATYQERGPTQSIQKLVKFGSAEEVLVCFGGIVRHTASWLSAFKAEKIIHLASTCSSFHFFTQRQQLVVEKLSAGAVEPYSPTHATALKNVAKSLQRGSTGLHLVAREFSILVYPSGSEGWDWLDGDARKPNLDSVLRHLIFRSPINYRAYPSECHKNPKVSEKLLYPDGASDPGIVGVLTGLDFTQLLPQNIRLKNKQTYMLLIPLKAQQLLGVIMAWLRFHQPDRPIFTVDQPNSWRLFHEAVQGGDGGTIICHADFTLWKLEKIPSVWQMLEVDKYTFWHLDTGERKRPQYPSDLGVTNAPGVLRLTRLFPYGRAFLITPSFVISEPAKLCTFLRWFKLYAANPGHIIVTCHNFPLFLKNIAEEKQKEHDTLKRLNPTNKDLWTFFSRAGRRREDIDDHYRACQLLWEIMERFGDEETSEDIRKIHWLSEFIDPSDEQSLVNAFCWWSQLKCDRFRRFYVLGSDSNNIQRAYRCIEIPRYFDTERSDPDIAGILIQRRLLAVEHHKASDKHGTELNITRGTGGIVDGPPRVAGEWRSPVCEAPFPFPGTLFRTNNVQELQRWIDEHRKRTLYNWSALHQRPVSWRDRNMAVQFGDGDEHKNQFDTFHDWCTSAPEFTKRRNTWYGLFYTITDTWDEHLPKRRYERHPWIAIYRPKNPHLISPVGGFGTIELFIWDIAATDRGKFGHCLLDMQRQLIDYFYHNVSEYYPKSSLSDVWYSSTTDLQIGPNDNLLDITCRRIEEMFTNGRDELPPKDHLLRDKWTRIDPRLWSAGMSSMTLRTTPAEKTSELAIKRIPQTDEDKLKPERMIWHPVRRGLRGHGTKCVNDLYEACLAARLKDPKCGHILYKYRPTQEWWAYQGAEGRDYGYICVDAAGRIIDRLPNIE